jgi:hypothetical protein
MGLSYRSILFCSSEMLSNVPNSSLAWAIFGVGAECEGVARNETTLKPAYGFNATIYFGAKITLVTLATQT